MKRPEFAHSHGGLDGRVGVWRANRGSVLGPRAFLFEFPLCKGGSQAQDGGVALASPLRQSRASSPSPRVRVPCVLHCPRVCPAAAWPPLPTQQSGE